MLTSLAISFVLQIPAPQPLIVLSDRVLESKEVKAIRDSSDPTVYLTQRLYKVRKGDGYMVARSPDIFRLESTQDRIAAGREIGNLARAGSIVARVRDLSPSAQRGLIYLSSDNWTERERALLMRQEAKFMFTSAVTVWASVNNQTIAAGRVAAGGPHEDPANDPPTEAEINALRKLPHVDMRVKSLSDLHIVFIRPGSSDEMLQICAEETKQLSDELKRQNKQLLDARTSLSVVSKYSNRYKEGELVSKYPEILEKMSQIASTGYKSYGFSSASQAIARLNTLTIAGFLPSVSMGVFMRAGGGQPDSGSIYQLRLMRY